jgi:hypothetical protein
MSAIIERLRKSIGWKVLILCVITTLICWRFTSSVTRFTLLALLYFVATFAFNISHNRSLFLVFMGIVASMVENGYIQHIASTWDYRKPDVGNIPYWLVPLWSIAMVVITELSKLSP